MGPASVPHRCHTPAVLAYLAFLVLLVWLSLDPAPPPMPGPLAWDKLQHAGAYAVLTVLGGLALGRRRPRGWLVSAVVAVVIGGGMELAQGALTTTRCADWHDLLADLVGAAAAAGCALMVAVPRRR